MLILYPRLPNGNVLWSCDNCDRTAQVTTPDTTAVALICICDGKVHPECNNEWYYQGLYWNMIPMERRNEYRRNRSKKILNG